MWKVDCYIHILKAYWRFSLYFFDRKFNMQDFTSISGDDGRIFEISSFNFGTEN